MKWKAGGNGLMNRPEAAAEHSFGLGMMLLSLFSALQADTKRYSWSFLEGMKIRNVAT